MKKKPTKVFEKVEAYNVIGPTVDVPYHVWHLFGEKQKTIQISWDDVSFGEDYGTLEEGRKALEWYVDQLGGKVIWKD